MFNIFSFLFGKTRRYYHIKENREQREESRFYAILSFVFSGLAVLFACTMFLWNLPLNGFTGFPLIITKVFVTYFIPVCFLIYSFVFITRQFSLNKRLLGWLAISFFILSIALFLFVVVR